MAVSRSTLQIVKYLHQDKARGRSNSIVEMNGEDGHPIRYIRDYSANVGAGSYGEVYRLNLESDPSQSILAKKEKPKKNGLFDEGYDMLQEAKNWVKVGKLGGYAGDPKSVNEPHIVIMPDLTSKTTLPLKEVKYNSSHDFLLMARFVLDKIDDFHQEHKLVHYDITENNVLFNEAEQSIQFVDLGLTRPIGAQVHPKVCDASCHSGQSSGYFPPELNPNKSDKLDKIAKPSHDTYLAGRMLTRMINKLALDRHGKQLTFISSIKAEFEAIANAMQAPAETRIDLVEAFRRMAKLTRLNQLLQNQDSLFHPDDSIHVMIDELLETLADPSVEIPLLTQHFKVEHQDTLLKLLSGKSNQNENENRVSLKV